MNQPESLDPDEYLWSLGQVEAVARIHRGLLWLTFVWLMSVFCVILSPGTLFVVARVILSVTWMCVAVWVLRLKFALGENLFFSVLVAALAILPFVNVAVLLFVHLEALGFFSRLHIPVGFMGVSPRNARRLIRPWLCRKCGYDLTGNVSGTCPECGTGLSDAQRELIAARPISNTDAGSPI